MSAVAKDPSQIRVFFFGLRISVTQIPQGLFRTPLYSGCRVSFAALTCLVRFRASVKFCWGEQLLVSTSACLPEFNSSDLDAGDSSSFVELGSWEELPGSKSSGPKPAADSCTHPASAPEYDSGLVASSISLSEFPARSSWLLPGDVENGESFPIPGLGRHPHPVRQRMTTSHPTTQVQLSMC